ncbi:MAG: tyrosine-type recombinase/integrase, partial [Paraglaciecola chathamensis]
IYAWIKTLEISNKRKNNILSPLRQMLKDAYLDGLIENNPMDRFRALPTDHREPNPFNQKEVAKILDKLAGQERNLIQFAFSSGLRTSELIALRWKDVDFKKNCIHVNAAIVRRFSS